MLGIKDNNEIIKGKYADVIYNEYKKRYGKSTKNNGTK